MGLFEKRIKYKIVFLRQEYSTMFLVFTKKLKIPQKLIRVGKKTFQINYEIPFYSNLLEKFYFVDYESGSQLKFEAIERKLNPDDLDLIVSNKIVKEIASGVLDDMKQKFLMILLGALLGGMLSAIILMGFYQSKIDEIYASQSNPFTFEVVKGIVRFFRK